MSTDRWPSSVGPPALGVLAFWTVIVFAVTADATYAALVAMLVTAGALVPTVALHQQARDRGDDEARLRSSARGHLLVFSVLAGLFYVAARLIG